MEPEGSLPYSQLPATCPYPELTLSSPLTPSNFLKINLNIGCPTTYLYTGCPTTYLYTEYPTTYLYTGCPTNYLYTERPTT
jgi:hypothetical protein